MTDNAPKIALLFGGRSAEHDVSILSARSVREASASRFQIIPICLARDGRFIDPQRSARILDAGDSSTTGDPEFSFETWSRGAAIDLAFPLIHGTSGEDGTLQGYLETIGLAYAGSGVAASAVGMDKIHMKHAFTTARLPIVDFVPVHESEWRGERDRVVRTIANVIRLPYFIKPANSGSSIGVRKAKNDQELAEAVEHAFTFDERILIERGIEGRELEVALLGNESVEASVPGEIVAGRDFYDYEDKYVDDKAQLIIPPKATNEKLEEVRRLAVAAFKSIGAAGYARVDFFLERGTSRIYVNEINTIPGFTRISMFPKLWEATEMKYPRVVEKIVELGLERWRNRSDRRARAMAWLEQAQRLE